MGDLHASFLRIQEDIAGGFQQMNTSGGVDDQYKSGASVAEKDDGKDDEKRQQNGNEHQNESNLQANQKRQETMSLV